MKKLSIVSLLLISFYSYSQAPLEKGRIQLNAGFGFSSWSNPIYFGGDYGLNDLITLGAEVSYQSYKAFDIKSTIIGVQANGNYHFNELLDIPSEFDVYAGLNVNYYSWTFKDSNSNTSLIDDEPFGIGAQIGGRYFFNEKIAINLEFGGGNATSGGKIGVTYKL